MANLGVKFGNIDFKNPVVMASGTFGFGKEYNEIYDIQKLGGVSSKGLTLEKRDGNKGMRVWETPSGMMNSVGLENPGVQGFIDNELQFFKGLDFEFIKVHNQQGFDKNAKILLEIIQMWQGLRLLTTEQNQFLGDMFEFFLDNGIKQSKTLSSFF